MRNSKLRVGVNLLNIKSMYKDKTKQTNPTIDFIKSRTRQRCQLTFLFDIMPKVITSVKMNQNKQI